MQHWIICIVVLTAMHCNLPAWTLPLLGFVSGCTVSCSYKYEKLYFHETQQKEINVWVVLHSCFRINIKLIKAVILNVSILIFSHCKKGIIIYKARKLQLQTWNTECISTFNSKYSCYKFQFTDFVFPCKKRV